MTNHTVGRPHLGWHTLSWGALRRWWVHREEHKRGEYNDDHWWEHRTEDNDEEEEQEQPERSAPEVGESAPQEQPLSRWQSAAQSARIVALWCAGALVVVIALDPAPGLLALALGGAGAALVLQHAAHQRTVEVLAHQVERERAELAAQAQRAERREQNRVAHEAERAERAEAARAEREAKRAANRAAHRGGEADG